MNWLGEHDGRGTYDAERKSRTARAAKEDGDQVWAFGLDGEGDEDVRNHVLAALQRTAWGVAGADRTPPYWGHLVKPSKGREQDVRIDPNGPRRREAGSTPAEIIAPARTLRGVLVLRRPDEETLAFWRMTADDFQEYVSRIARFSRALSEKSARNAVQSLSRNAAIAAEPRRSKPPGRLLVMPSPTELGSRSSSRSVDRNTGLLQGGNYEGSRDSGKKNRQKTAARTSATGDGLSAGANEKGDC